jgi:Outer membrane lipoprotein carrier protein LolA-like
MPEPARKYSAAREAASFRGDSGGFRFALGLLLLLSSIATANAAGDPFDALLAALAQQPHGAVKFSEETHSQLLTRPVHSEGVLRFDAPDRLEKQTLTPVAEDLIVEGDVVTIIRGHHRSSIRLSQYPKLSPLLEGIRATLGGNRAALEQRFEVTFVPVGSEWELRLAPLGGARDAGFTRIVLRGHDDALQSVALEQANGDRTTMALAPMPPG